MTRSILQIALLAGLASAAHAETDAAGHWAFQPLVQPRVPAVRDASWPATDVDRFLLAKLEAAQRWPVADASPEVLLRRLTFDLAGRPPTVAEQDAFFSAPAATRLPEAVDRLLASPEFGERWAQHWLDVARYADSSGGGRSMMFPAAYRYRDYVIEAFNNDVPFDQFVREQLAGDQLPAEDAAQRDRQTIATGFLTLGAINYELQDKKLLEMEIVDEQIDVVGRAFLGLSLGCARCHDHKFDPIATEEYYGLAGIFASTHSVVHENVGRPFERPLTDGDEVVRYRKLSERLKELTLRIDELESQQKQTDDDAEKAALSDRLKPLLEEKEKLAAGLPRRPTAMAVVDIAEPGDTFVRYGGDVHHAGPLVPRTFVSIAGLPEQTSGETGVPEIADGVSGRLELARWIASPANRLTSRVIVNRVWRHLFGEGIVATPDDFGVTGRPPTHPELLDYLAAEFINDGWSIKTLVRRLTLSRAYRIASTPSAELLEADPANRLLGRARRRQLDADAIRDAMLFVSGRLVPQRGGPSIAKLAQYDAGYEFVSRRRSIYVPRFRNVQPDVIAAFGGANPNMVTGARSPSILPSQALYMLNGPLVIETSQHAAESLLELDCDQTGRVTELYRRAVGRRPTDAEVELAASYLATMRKLPEGDERSQLAAWSGLVQLVFASVDFRFLQ